MCACSIESALNVGWTNLWCQILDLFDTVLLTLRLCLKNTVFWEFKVKDQGLGIRDQRWRVKD